MEFSLNTPSLLAALSKVLPARGKEDSLASVLFIIQSKRLTLIASNGKITLKSSLDCHCEDAKFLTDGAVLHGVIQSYSGETIDLKLTDSTLNVSFANCHYKLPLVTSSFPLIDESIMKNTQTITISSDDFLDCLKTSYAMAKQDVRYYLNGLHFKISSNRIRTQAADGHRICLYETTGEYTQDAEVIIPYVAIALIKSHLSKSKNTIVLTFDKAHLMMQYDNFEIITKLVAGKYPDTDPYRASTPSRLIEINKNDFKEMLNRIIKTMNNIKVPCIRIYFDSKKPLTIVNRDGRIEAKESINIIKSEGEPLDFACSIKYLLEAISSVDDEQITLKINDTNTPVFIDSGNYRHAVMPVTLH